MRYIITIETEKDGLIAEQDKFSFQKAAGSNGEDITDLIDWTDLLPMVKDSIMKEFELRLDKVLSST